jgi:hypothetical protein
MTHNQAYNLMLECYWNPLIADNDGGSRTRLGVAALTVGVEDCTPIEQPKFIAWLREWADALEGKP